MRAKIEPPRPIELGDNVGAFCSGNEALDGWFKKRAFRVEGNSARTYVACVGERIAGFYALAAGSVSREWTPGSIRRNMPQPIPIILLARLAVDREWQGKGIGRGLIRDANLRVLNAASILGVRAILVHAVDDSAAKFYLHCGFIQSPLERRILFFPIDALRSMSTSTP